MKGIYCLIIFLKKSQRIKIGQRTGFFTRSYYCYIGSAQNNLEKRIERHLRRKKKKHWHIDYFLEKAEIRDIIVKRKTKECKLSEILKELGGKVIFVGFGSSDCSCQAHLYKFSTNPLRIKKFINAIRKIN